MFFRAKPITLTLLIKGVIMSKLSKDDIEIIEQELEKGWKGALAGAALGIGSSMGQATAPESPAHTQQMQAAPQPKPVDLNFKTKLTKPLDIDHDHKAFDNPKKPADPFHGLHPDLNAISYLETSHGKNLNHTKNHKGDFYTRTWYSSY